ncbi:hypothetical protein PSEUDO9AG_40993 [Pseudomonas sp. 9Ag]|nr:hypothetical protein PSEUDO9AG_40993 [Pseudomonas sp. 9Ag]
MSAPTGSGRLLLWTSYNCRRSYATIAALSGMNPYLYPNSSALRTNAAANVRPPDQR